jgi:hypothetical protein
VTPAVLVYDGDCSLCRDWARRVEGWAGGRLVLRGEPGLAAVRLEEGARVLEGPAALRRICAIVPVLRPLWPVAPALPRLAEAAFQLRERLAGR